MARPMELNYSVLGQIPLPAVDAQPSPTAHAGKTGLPELCYGDVPLVPEKARVDASVSTPPVCLVYES